MTDLLTLITPINFLSEQDKFLRSHSYNPTFQYIWQKEEFNPEFTIKLKYPLWEAIKLQDHPSITQAAGNLFQVKFNSRDLLQAQDKASTKGIVSTGSAQVYVKLLQESLAYFRLNDIAVILSEESGFNSRPRHAAKQVIVSKHIHFEYFSMEAGVRHEMVHVIRYRNGKYNKINRSQNFLPTEEGLASWCQDHTNDDNGEAQHAMEYVGSSIGVEGSLRDIFDYMKDQGMSKELAWKRAARHKFGFIDTSKPGDIMKPAMYYANELQIDKLTTDEKLRLFVGKINQIELDRYPNYKGKWSDNQLISYFNL